MIYFLYRSFVPNTAISNRLIAYLRNVERLKIHITVVFFLPDERKSRIEDNFQHVEFKYYWERFYINQPSLKYISFLWYLFKFNCRLKRGDKVFIYGCNDILKFVWKKGIDLYLEITESPEVFLSGSRLYSPTLEGHLNLCKRLNGLIVISNQLKDYYITQGIPQDHIHTVNMIVDPERFDKIDNRKNDEKYIAYCGNVSNNKDGVDILLKAFSIIAEKNKDVKLYIIGPIPSAGENNNMALIEDLGIKDQVVLTGMVSSNEMPRLLKNAIAVVLARPDNKQAQYGFPTKLGEYLLTGNPVIVTTVGDIPLYLKDGENALLAEPNNIEQFAEKMIWVLKNPEKCKMIGDKGREVALKDFNAAIETNKLLNVLCK